MSFSKLRERRKKAEGGGEGEREESNGLQLKSIVFDTANKNRREVKALHIKHPPTNTLHVSCANTPYKDFACVVVEKGRNFLGSLLTYSRNSYWVSEEIPGIESFVLLVMGLGPRFCVFSS